MFDRFFIADHLEDRTVCSNREWRLRFLGFPNVKRNSENFLICLKFKNNSTQHHPKSYCLSAFV